MPLAEPPATGAEATHTSGTHSEALVLTALPDVSPSALALLAAL